MTSSNLAEFADESVSPMVRRAGAWIAFALALAVWFAPTPEGLAPAGQRLAAIAGLMAVLWTTQAIPMEVTSLLPLALFPLAGILSAKKVSETYFSDSSFLYLGGFILALGIERWGLHRRIALAVIARTGTGPQRTVLGFMLATFLLSMWISNTAATLIMLPIALALLSSLERYSPERSAVEVEATVMPTTDRDFRRFATALVLGIAYAATLGGMATIVGTPTNVVYGEVFRRQFPDGPAVSAGQWMAIWTPFALVFAAFTWLLLTAGIRRPAWLPADDATRIRSEQDALGPMSQPERWMLVLFALTALLWLTRTPLEIGNVTLWSGWSQMMKSWLDWLGTAPSRDYVNDSTVAMAMATLLFIVRARPALDSPRVPLMDWQTASKLPWGILLLFGGGFALAEGCHTTGLAEWAGGGLARAAAGQPIWVLIVAVCLLVTLLSEFTSNVATANALLPIVAGMAISLDVDPRLLMLPATVAASCGFMLPISTPPSAIAFGTGRVRLGSMLRYGAVLDVVGPVLLVVGAFWLMAPMLRIEYSGRPEWARPAAAASPEQRK